MGDGTAGVLSQGTASAEGDFCLRSTMQPTFQAVISCKLQLTHLGPKDNMECPHCLYLGENHPGSMNLSALYGAGAIRARPRVGFWT